MNWGEGEKNTVLRQAHILGCYQEESRVEQWGNYIKTPWWILCFSESSIRQVDVPVWIRVARLQTTVEVDAPSCHCQRTLPHGSDSLLLSYISFGLFLCQWYKTQTTGQTGFQFLVSNIAQLFFFSSLWRGCSLVCSWSLALFHTHNHAHRFTEPCVQHGIKPWWRQISH